MHQCTSYQKGFWGARFQETETPVSHVLSIHQRLLTGTRLEEYAGQLRTTQNWIGGSDYNPCSAAFIPPPHEHVKSLLEDLCAFCNSDSLPAVAQAAIAHAQFETIHPFVDGNGRTGRALIHVVLRRRGLAPRVLPPVSLVLATWSADYVGGLTATRYCGPETSRAAHDGLDQWIALFAAATRRAVSDAERYEERVAELQAAWRERVGRGPGELRRRTPHPRPSRGSDHDRQERSGIHRPQRAGRE